MLAWVPPYWKCHGHHLGCWLIMLPLFIAAVRAWQTNIICGFALFVYNANNRGAQLSSKHWSTAGHIVVAWQEVCAFTLFILLRSKRWHNAFGLSSVCIMMALHITHTTSGQIVAIDLLAVSVLAYLLAAIIACASVQLDIQHGCILAVIGTTPSHTASCGAHLAYLIEIYSRYLSLESCLHARIEYETRTTLATLLRTSHQIN